LAKNPNVGRLGRVSGTRELVVSRTPYIVVYRVGARGNPGDHSWRTRLAWELLL